MDLPDIRVVTEEDEPTVSEQAAAVIGAERQPQQSPERELDFQWNVPLGVAPHVPAWLSLVFIAAFVVAGLLLLLSRL